MSRKRAGRKSSEAVRPFNGIANYASDDAVEAMLQAHFARFELSTIEAAKNFPIYARRTTLKRFLAHYEMFRLVVDLPGDIIELGVFRGSSLMTWANLLEIRNMGDRQKQVFGFDNWSGFKELHAKDGKEDRRVDKVGGGFDGSGYEAALEDAIRVFDSDRFIPHKPRVKLIKGDIEKTVPQFVRDNPGLRVSLIHFDCDVYVPTRVGLEQFWPLVVPGGVVIFDEYGIRPWEGESKAVDEFFEGKKVQFRKLDWSPNPGAYVVKK
jgi:macrocin-O-methyltransferase TylF-like protien